MDVKAGGAGPSPRSHHTATFCDSRLFVFGGCDDKSCVFNDLYILELGLSAYLPLQPTVLLV